MVRSTFFGFEASKSALFSNQKALDIVGNNLANANTDGYTRQRVETTATTYSASINRLAADDLSEEIARVYHSSLALSRAVKTELVNSNIHLLGKSDYALFRKRLYGELSTWQPIAIKEE